MMAPSSKRRKALTNTLEVYLLQSGGTATATATEETTSLGCFSSRPIISI